MANRGFENFDFSKSSEWLSYYENIFPLPEPARLLKIKQKWYKDHVDSTYNANPAPPSPNQVPRSSVVLPSSMQLFQVCLFSLSLFGLYFGKALHFIIAGHFAGIIHFHNMPKLNLAYWRPVISDDNMHAIAFALLCLVLPINALWVVPAYLGTLIYTAEVMLKHPKVPEKIKAYARKIEEKKMFILQTRADCEVWVGFALIVLVLLGSTHWIAPIIYWQYTRMRYVINYFSKITFANLRVKGDSLFFNKPGVGLVWGKLKTFCDWLCTVDSNSSPSCEIF